MLQEELMELQSPDGSWRLCCESGVMSDAYLLIWLQALGEQENDRELIRRIGYRIASMQEESGGWKLFADQKEGPSGI